MITNRQDEADHISSCNAEAEHYYEELRLREQEEKQNTNKHMKTNINVEVLKGSVKSNHAISNVGPGLFPCSTEWEDNVNSANSILATLMSSNGFSDGEIMMELGMTAAEYSTLLKFSQRALDPLEHLHDRFLVKKRLVLNSYKRRVKALGVSELIH